MSVAADVVAFVVNVVVVVVVVVADARQLHRRLAPLCLTRLCAREERGHQLVLLAGTSCAQQHHCWMSAAVAAWQGGAAHVG